MRHALAQRQRPLDVVTLWTVELFVPGAVVAGAYPVKY
jgi:hypothetical protein